MTGSVLKTNTTIFSAYQQPWLRSRLWDMVWIMGPAFLSSFVVLLFRQQMIQCPHLPLWAWVSFVLCVDVAHVYATLFRTYFDKRAFQRNSTLLISAPVLCWIVGSLLYAVNALLFWRVLAYLAVFHFVRQQYGFVVLYSRKEPAQERIWPWLDHLAVYAATVYPLLFWHTRLPRNFDWFVAGDFVTSLPVQVADLGLWIYGAIAAAYLLREGFVLLRYRRLNLPKNLIVVGTALSWWTGIISVNSDLAFTMTNVLTHGIPYMALVWLYHRRSAESTSAGHNQDEGGQPLPLGADGNRTIRRVMSTFNRIALSQIGAFLLFLICLAYIEEGLWAGFIWREHFSVFRLFANLPAIQDEIVLAIVVPLLSLPQSTHYILDGFIWRVKDRDSVWSA